MSAILNALSKCIPCIEVPKTGERTPLKSAMSMPLIPMASFEQSVLPNIIVESVSQPPVLLPTPPVQEMASAPAPLPKRVVLPVALPVAMPVKQQTQVQKTAQIAVKKQIIPTPVPTPVVSPAQIKESELDANIQQAITKIVSLIANTKLYDPGALKEAKKTIDTELQGLKGKITWVDFISFANDHCKTDFKKIQESTLGVRARYEFLEKFVLKPLFQANQDIDYKKHEDLGTQLRDEGNAFLREKVAAYHWNRKLV